MKLSDLDFSALLPRFMRAQTDDVAMGDALSWMLKARQAGVESLNVLEWLRTTTNVEQMDDLAQAFGLAWWKPDWDLETKREMLLKSELIRQNPGTKWALETLLQKWFGDPELVVEEWFDYGGLPYTFRVLTESPDVQKKLQFSRIMETLKRTSQSMDGIFLGFSMRGQVFLGAKGSESRTTRGEAMRWPYIPKGTRYTHPDALEEFLWESGQTGTDAARAAVSDATGTGGVLTKDFPLIFAGDDTTTALPIKSTTRVAYQQAMASRWAAVGAEIAEPAASWVWPIPAPGGGLAEGCIGYWGFGVDEMSGGVDLTNAVDGSTGVLTGTVPASAAGGLIGAGIAGVRATSGTRSDCRIRLLQMPDTTNWTVSRWGLKDSGFYRPTLFSTAEDMKGIIKPTWGRYDASNFNVNFDSTFRFAAVLPADGWHHVVLTREGAMTSLFVNGVLQSQREMDASFAIGGRYFGVDFLAGGYNQVLDEVAVWSRALSAEEVSQLYQAGLDGKSYPFA